MTLRFLPTKLCRSILAIAVLSWLNGVSVLDVFAQDVRMTKAFNEDVRSYASENGAAFVAGCKFRRGNLLLVIPVGGTTGWFAAIANRQLFNGTLVKITKQGLSLGDFWGGEYTEAELGFEADSLFKSEFRIVTGDELRALVNFKPDKACSRFEANESQ